MNRIFHIKLFILIFCLWGAVPAFSQSTLRVACYYNGFWGEWSDYWTNCWGSYGGFLLYGYNEHKSNYCFAFKIDGYTTPSKKEIKEHRKNDEWWSYTGTIEYYVSDVYPTLKSSLMALGRPLKESDTEGYSYKYERLPLARANNMNKYGEVIGFTKMTRKATIKIAPYKKHPDTYNIWVDDVGFAISLNGCSFRE